MGIKRNIAGTTNVSFSLPSDWEKTIGSGKDYASIALMKAALERRYASYPKTTLDAGTYDEIILDGTEKLLCECLELVGDTRTIVGTTYMRAYTIQTPSANGGSGTCGITSDGNDITVTGSGANPDFATAGLVNGDKVAILNDVNAMSEHTVDSVSGNVITLTGAAPTFADGKTLTILPNRIITNTTYLLYGNFPCKLKFTGFTFKKTATGYTFDLRRKKVVEINNCVFDQTGQASSCILLADSSLYSTVDYSNSFLNSQSHGISTIAGSVVYAKGVANVKTLGVALVNGSSGYMHNLIGTHGGLNAVNQASKHSNLVCDSSQVYGYYRGLQADINSCISTSGTTIKGCTIGVYAVNQSHISALSMTMASNSTDYSPATSGVAGNVNSTIVYS